MNSIFVTILFFWMKMANRFSGKSSFNKLSLLIGVPLKSIQVKEWNKKIRSIGTFVKKKKKKRQLNNIKVGRTPIWGYLEFICYIIFWNIWKLKKFLMCAYGFANLDICWSRLMAVFILLCCTLWIIFLNNSNNKSNQNFWLIFHIIWISNAWP